MKVDSDTVCTFFLFYFSKASDKIPHRGQAILTFLMTRSHDCCLNWSAGLRIKKKILATRLKGIS